MDVGNCGTDAGSPLKSARMLWLVGVSPRVWGSRSLVQIDSALRYSVRSVLRCELILNAVAPSEVSHVGSCSIFPYEYSPVRVRFFSCVRRSPYRRFRNARLRKDRIVKRKGDGKNYPVRGWRSSASIGMHDCSPKSTTATHEPTRTGWETCHGSGRQIRTGRD